MARLIANDAKNMENPTNFNGFARGVLCICFKKVC